MQYTSILSRVKRGIITRPQRVVLYGVESVGKTTLAAQADSPIILDVEDGSTHLDVPRISINSWNELEAAITELRAGNHDFRTVIIDSMDWAEKLAVEDMLSRDKKTSLEDYGYGKGYTMAAERTARFLASLDRLIDAGIGVCLIAHAKVTRFEPPDGMAAYDRYELKMTRQTSPLVKEWADALLFANFKTRVVEAQSGRAKGLGGKERIILTQRAAAYDAKCRIPGITEEIPMTWEAVRPIFGVKQETKADPAKPAKDRWEMLAFNIGEREGLINQFLIARGIIMAGQTWRDAGDEYLRRVETQVERFIKAAQDWYDAEAAK